MKLLLLLISILIFINARKVKKNKVHHKTRGGISLAVNKKVIQPAEEFEVTWDLDHIQSEGFIRLYPPENENSKGDHSHHPVEKKLTGSSGVTKLKGPAFSGTYKLCLSHNDKCLESSDITIVKCLDKNTTKSAVQHVIVVLSENHSFDSIYGNYCLGDAKPKCNYGPYCCEAAPKTVQGVRFTKLNDAANAARDPCHTAECEVSEIDGGSMDKFISGGVGSHPQNFAIATGEKDSAYYYYKWARKGAIADNFFQSSAGASAQNNMYFAAAKYFFKDNEMKPQNKDLKGNQCFDNSFISYYDNTIADLLNKCDITWTFYSAGYNQDLKQGQCYPNYYDATDNPFTYFPSLNSDKSFRDFEELEKDIEKGSLPSVSYVKFLGVNSEHPGYKNSLISGQLMTNNIVKQIKKSKYYENTIIIMVPDESGGFYDHVSPPGDSEIDKSPYGPRTPFVMVGPTVKQHYVSHVQMESSSIVKFIEWNWLDGEPGQLGQRDKVVNNLGDMFLENKTRIKVPI
jgi:phospholipase C